MKPIHALDMLFAMSFALPIFAADSSSASDLATLLPSVPPPTTTRDPWQCATENITDYFNVPMATGALNSALNSYGKSLFAECTLTGTDITACPIPDSTAWCQFSTAAPSSVLSAYSSYGSIASSWWANHQSAALSLAENCPYGWYRAGSQNLFGFTALNETIIFAGCYAEAQATSGPSSTTLPSGPTAIPGSKPTASGPSPTSTPGSTFTTSSGSISATSKTPSSISTIQSSSVVGITDHIHLWAAAFGFGTAAFAVLVL